MLVRRLIPVLRFLERFTHPRWPTPIQATRCVLSVQKVLLGVSILVPIPFTQCLLALVVIVIALAYLEGDGVVLTDALGAALLSLAATGAGPWAAYWGAGSI